MRIRRLVPLLALLTAAGAGAEPEPEGGLTVRFTGLEEMRGELIVALSNSSAMWDDGEDAFRDASIAVDGPVATAHFPDLPAGFYAVKVFHDANSNLELDMGFTGPKEKFGFSNNVMGFLGPPDFEDARFRYDGSALTITVDAF